jgi:AsmA protein
MLKKSLIGLGVVLGVFALGLVALALFIDANKYKPEIEQYVRDHYKRNVKFDGDLSLSLFPQIALDLPQTTLSNLAGDRASASLKSGRVSAALLPLLHRRIEVDAISIDGLTATIERRHDGSTSIDDLLKRNAGESQAGGSTAQAPDFEVGAVELTDADITFNDLEGRRTVHLSKLELKTGRLAPIARSPIEFQTQFEVSKPEASGQIRVAATLDLDLGKQVFAASDLDAAVRAALRQQPFESTLRAERVAYIGASGGIEAIKVDAKGSGQWGMLTLDEGRLVAPALAFDRENKQLAVGGLELSAKGKSDADAFEAILTAPKLEISEKAAAGQRVVLTAKFAPAAANLPTGTAHLTLEGMSGNAQKIEVARVALDAEGNQGSHKFAAALSGALTASLESQTMSLPRIAGEITVDDPALPQPTLKVPLTARISVDANAENIDAGFASKIDETNAAAELSVRGFSTPKIIFEASADRLNVDRYFPARTPSPGNDSADSKEDPKIDLAPLRNLDLSGTVKIGSLQMRGLKASSVDAGVKAADGHLAVAPLTAQLYGGSLAGSANLIAEGNQVKVDTQLSNVAIQALTKDLLERDLVEGNGDVKLDFATAGATASAMKQHVDGTASIRLRDGAIKGVDLVAKLRDAKTLLVAATKGDAISANAAERTDFSELNATFTIKDGVAVNEDLELKSPLLRIAGSGKVDIAAATLEYATGASVVGTLKGRNGRPVDQLRGITVPVRISGPLDRLAWMIDWDVAAQEALRLQAAQKAAQQAQAEKDAVRAAVEQRARDAMKEFLKK